MSIVFSVLHVLLVILLVILIVLLILLFTPICYSFEGQKEDPVGNDKFEPETLLTGLSGNIKVSWIFGLVGFSAGYPGDPAHFRILFFHIGPKKPEKKEKPDNEAQRQLEKDQKEQEEQSEGKEEEKASPEEGMKEEKSTERETAGKPRRRFSGWKKLKKKVRYYLWVLERDETGRALAKAKKKIMFLLRHILPKKYEISGTVGLGDPAASGKAFEVFGFLYPLMCGHVFLEPEYTKYRFDLRASGKGHVMPVSLAAALIPVFFDRDIRITVRRFRKQKEHSSNGGEQ